MRLLILTAVAATVASPALAQVAPAPVSSVPVTPPPVAQVPQRPAPMAEPIPPLPPELTDGRMFDQLGDVMGVLAKTMLNLPVGEIEAAMENRPVTRADRRKTVASESGMDERELRRSIDQSKGAMRAGGQALVRSLPAINRALSQAGAEIEKALANLPSPAYPRR